jgi:hypothetical protein
MHIFDRPRPHVNYSGIPSFADDSAQAPVQWIIISLTLAVAVEHDLASRTFGEPSVFPAELAKMCCRHPTQQKTGGLVKNRSTRLNLAQLTGGGNQAQAGWKPYVSLTQRREAGSALLKETPILLY